MAPKESLQDSKICIVSGTKGTRNSECRMQSKEPQNVEVATSAVVQPDPYFVILGSLLDIPRKGPLGLRFAFSFRVLRALRALRGKALPPLRMASS
jgi:hypothetical protein